MMEMTTFYRLSMKFAEGDAWLEVPLEKLKEMDAAHPGLIEKVALGNSRLSNTHAYLDADSSVDALLDIFQDEGWELVPDLAKEADKRIPNLVAYDPALVRNGFIDSVMELANGKADVVAVRDLPDGPVFSVLSHNPYAEYPASDIPVHEAAQYVRSVEAAPSLDDDAAYQFKIGM
jgi:hypothetical protein